jgi:hypothetical protein
LTSLERGIGIAGVTTADGEVAFLFLLFFFFFAAFTVETAAAANDTNCFITADLVLHRDLAVPPASGPVPALPPTSTSVSSLASTDESDS